MLPLRNKEEPDPQSKVLNFFFGKLHPVSKLWALDINIQSARPQAVGRLIVHKLMEVS